MKLNRLHAALVAITLGSSPTFAAPPAQQAYLKASNTGGSDSFGRSVSISGDTLVVGAHGEASTAAGVNGNQNDNGAAFSGAVYVFVRQGTNWVQQAYLKASNPGGSDFFGDAVALSGDTLIVGAQAEDSTATGVNGDQANNGRAQSGAAYVFVRSGTNWSQQAYLKASNTGLGWRFGSAVAIAGDTVVIGATGESSSSTGVNGNQQGTGASESGAAYVFVRDGTNWTQQAYFKASNTGASDQLGWSVSISGETVVVGGPGESSNATGANGNSSDNTAARSGAAYVFLRNGTNWSQEAYLKASNTGAEDRFGEAVSISGDALIVGAKNEGSGATGVNGDGNNNNALNSGAAYVFTRTGTNWSQQAYLKASNAQAADQFGFSLSIEGDTAVVGAWTEAGSSTGLNGNQADNNAAESGAAYCFVRRQNNWFQQTYLKASNTGLFDRFARSISISGDTILVGAPNEQSNATGVNGNQTDNSLSFAGASYVFSGFIQLPFLVMQPDGLGGYFIRTDGTGGLSYELHRATSVTGPWTTNVTLTALTNGPIEFHDTNAPPGQAFYRVAQQ